MLHYDANLSGIRFFRNFEVVNTIKYIRRERLFRPLHKKLKFCIKYFLVNVDLVKFTVEILNNRKLHLFCSCLFLSQNSYFIAPSNKVQLIYFQQVPKTVKIYRKTFLSYLIILTGTKSENVIFRNAFILKTAEIFSKAILFYSTILS